LQQTNKIYAQEQVLLSLQTFLGNKRPKNFFLGGGFFVFDMEEEVRVPLSSWVRNCRKKLEHKKNNGTQLKGRRQFVIDVEPCPQALFMALCKLIWS